MSTVHAGAAGAPAVSAPQRGAALPGRGEGLPRRTPRCADQETCREGKSDFKTQ